MQYYKLRLMRKRTIAICALLGLVISGVALFFVLNMTNPSDGGPAIILLVLLLIYCLTYGIIVLLTMVLWYIYHLIAPKRQTTTSDEKLRRSMRKMLAVCGILSATPILIISLNSIGRMSFVDIVLIIATEGLAIFYIVRKF